MEKPRHTRLRFAKASKAETLVAFLANIPRVQVYGAPVWIEKEKRWYLWFVPNDNGMDIISVDLG